MGRESVFIILFQSNMSDPSKANTVSDSCCCLYMTLFLLRKREKRNIIGEFAETFGDVCKEKNQ